MERLTVPSPETIEAARALRGDVLILGAGGKMGSSLALMMHRSLAAARSAHKVLCVSRFSDAGAAMTLGQSGIRTIACDLMNRKDLERLPDAPYVMYLVGSKFGTTTTPSHTWAINTLLPASVAERFRAARIVALSTGNVYPLVSPATGGATEDTPPEPVGEYAQSCLGRERVLAYVSGLHDIPMLIVRLNYATDLRYGVLLDLAQRIAGRDPVSVGMGFFNTIWQGDANRVLCRAFGLCASPPAILNLTGPDTVSVRSVSYRLASALGAPEPAFYGQEQATALISNAQRCWSMLGGPSVSTDTLIEWTAAWVRNAGATLGRPTHFEVRDGKF
ncbi:MAG: NAD-dependent epimerase/dehydratase family protein [Armatimonadetes bacterium]|nr:NAD-dependent epimerase/dehydratase family protein [Armatimonadota bacterium]